MYREKAKQTEQCWQRSASQNAYSATKRCLRGSPHCAPYRLQATLPEERKMRTTVKKSFKCHVSAHLPEITVRRTLTTPASANSFLLLSTKTIFQRECFCLYPQTHKNVYTKRFLRIDATDVDFPLGSSMETRPARERVLCARERKRTRYIHSSNGSSGRKQQREQKRQQNNPPLFGFLHGRARTLRGASNLREDNNEHHIQNRNHYKVEGKCHPVITPWHLRARCLQRLRYWLIALATSPFARGINKNQRPL